MDSRRYLTSLSIFYLQLFLHYIRAAETNYTFAQRDSYAAYIWGNAQDGQAQFSFRTSQSDALLFYQGNDNEGGDYLVVWLEDGRLTARSEVSGVVLEATFGDHLNDLNLHTLLILHFNNQFDFYLDILDRPIRSLSYDLDHRFHTRSRVYIGGLPTSFTPAYRAATAMSSLAGCLEGVMFAHDSTQFLDLRPRTPVSKHRLQEGCVNGCENADCNGGRCVRSWSNPRGYFCDCSAASGVGEFCNMASSNYRLDVQGDRYNCYTLTHQPFTGRHNDIVVQLQFPIPHSGTILSGHSKNWTNQFSLYLKDDIIHYQIDNVTRALSAILQDQNYRISIITSQPEAERRVKIESLSSTNQIINAHTTALHLSSGEIETVFEFVCVGGGQMEVPIYRGRMERIFVGHNALLEPRNHSDTVVDGVKRASLIRLTNYSSPQPLTFEKHGLHSERFSFEFRLAPTQTAGVLLIAGNETAQLMVTIFNPTSEYLFSDGITNPAFCGNISLNDNQWHHFQFSSLSGGGGIVIEIDPTSLNSCTFTSKLNFDSSFLQLGPMTNGFVGTPIPFIGCFQNFEFVTGSEIFQPNLEVPILQYDRFSGNGCYGCQGTNINAYCSNRGVCQHTGAYQKSRCECPEFFSGPTCEGIGFTTTSSPSPSPTSTVTIITPSPPTSETTPTIEEPSSEETKNNEIDYDALGQWVGIATAIILVLILLIVLMVFIGCFVHSHRLKGSGFYSTHENRASVTLPHFSASLKTAHSHTLNLEQNRVTAITNGHTVHPTYSSGEKEFYI